MYPFRTPLRYVLSPSVSSSLHSHLSEDLDWSSLEPRSSSSSNTAPTTAPTTSQGKLHLDIIVVVK